MKLSFTTIIPVLQKCLFIVIRVLQKGLQATSEGKALIIKKIRPQFLLMEEMANNCGKGFPLTTKICMKPNNAAIWGPNNFNLEGKAYVDTEGAAVKEREQNTAKQPEIQKTHINQLHLKLSHI